ncbi:MAG: hypothetical protein B7Z08_04715 [Sphingomonadales bacterium 32-68-7]|nr:MAG: hypothetical protein B7Z33_09035 [Sphingomonadales bacterium 12-68-11]OYX09542.1 MAG: hypothetical protein B7Z08_04715 [Sphingomonadales bacterium 32-68-7]
MIARLLPIAALLAAVPASAQAPAALSLEQRMLLRCSAAFALVANRQAAGDAEALGYRVAADKAREFFVRSSAQVMDEAGLDRPAIAAALQREAQDLLRPGALAAIMPPCLAALNASGI